MAVGFRVRTRQSGRPRCCSRLLHNSTFMAPTVATSGGKGAPTTGAPNQTYIMPRCNFRCIANPYIRLYIKNLSEKINKNELKRALYMLFSTYGSVLDIVTMRKNMRGQAHVVYKDIQTSTQAMRALQGFELFGKEMVGLHVPPCGKSLNISRRSHMAKASRVSFPN